MSKKKKLKAELERLHKDMRTLVFSENFVDVEIIIETYRTKYKMVDIVMVGNPTIEPPLPRDTTEGSYQR